MLEPRVHPFKSREALLGTATNFLVLRPVFTLRFLRAVWYAYLIFQGYRLLWWIWLAVDAPPNWAQVGMSVWSITYPVLNILLVRVLLEVAAVILLGPGYGRREDSRPTDEMQPGLN